MHARAQRRTFGLRTQTSERGSSAIELVLLTPVLMVCMLLVVQFALWQHARHVLLAAAQEGARAARAQGGTADEGRIRAYDYIRQLGPNLVSSPVVAVERGADTVAVRITGRAVNIVPGLPLQVTATSTGPVERFRAP